MTEAVATTKRASAGPARGDAAAAEAAREVLARSGVRYVYCFFTDVRGILQSFTIPVEEFTEGRAFEEGIGFDGSSVRGFKTIDESDMMWLPDPVTLRVIPWVTDPIQKAALLLGDVYEAYGGGPAECDPRGAVKRVVEKARAMGYAPIMAPEIEFFVFQKFDPTRLVWDLWVSPSGGKMDAWGGPRPLPESPELGNGRPGIRPKEGYFRAPPEDTTNDFRNELAHYLTQLGVRVEYHHHEVATAGQVELDYKPMDPVACADAAVVYKFAAKNVAKMRDMIAVFMPKPLYLDNASGMHTHQSLWKDGVNAFYDSEDEYAELSQVGRWYVGGLLAHAKALTAITCPTVNSYKRLVPGFEAPINIMWSRRNRSALCRIPVYKRGPEFQKEKRVEYRAADPTANPYLAFAAMLAAGLDGIEKRIEPPAPVDRDVYEMSEGEKAALGIGALPTTLKDALAELEKDEVICEALGETIVRAFVELKTSEWNQYCLQLTPWEVVKYLDY
jgi:glutamine synthetase